MPAVPDALVIPELELAPLDDVIPLAEPGCPPDDDEVVGVSDEPLLASLLPPALCSPDPDEVGFDEQPTELAPSSAAIAARPKTMCLRIMTVGSAPLAKGGSWQRWPRLLEKGVDPPEPCREELVRDGEFVARCATLRPINPAERWLVP